MPHDGPIAIQTTKHVPEQTSAVPQWLLDFEDKSKQELQNTRDVKSATASPRPTKGVRACADSAWHACPPA